MYSIRTLTSSSSLVAQSLRLLAPADQRALAVIVFQQKSSPQTRWQSSATSAAVSFKMLQQKQGKVLSSSPPAGASVGAKGRTLPPYMVFRYCQQTATGSGQQSMSGHTSVQSHSTIAWDMTHSANSTTVDAEMTKVRVYIFT